MLFMVEFGMIIFIEGLSGLGKLSLFVVLWGVSDFEGMVFYGGWDVCDFVFLVWLVWVG